MASNDPVDDLVHILIDLPPDSADAAYFRGRARTFRRTRRPHVRRRRGRGRRRGLRARALAGADVVVAAAVSENELRARRACGGCARWPRGWTRSSRRRCSRAAWRLPRHSFHLRMTMNYEGDYMQKLTMFIVSDSIGETAELVAKAAASQFGKDLESVTMKRFSHIEDETQLKEIVFLAEAQNAVIVYTLVKSSMRLKLKEECLTNEILCIDLLGPVLDQLSKKLGKGPLEEPGLVRKLNEDYFKKIEAIEFAVKYDDGRDPRGILKADIVLIGVSRTSKTPLSQYLAYKRYKVANVPLVPEVDPPEELYMIDPKKCFALIILPEKLNSIRKERLIALGLRDDANYAKLDRIESEIEHFKKVTSKIGCTVIDVTSRAVEETANVIIAEITNQNK